MAAEIALVQRMHVVLGHPSYALIVVLAGMLVATGLGSALSPRVIASRRAVRFAALGTAALLALLPYAVIRPLATLTTDGQFWVRVLWSGATAALVGVCLGVFFPSGVRYLDRARGASVALAINGATSVLGSVLAIVLSVWFGIAASFAGAACFYALAAWAAPVAWRPVDDATA
jgi:predicted membrane-bound spermidine synthase